MQATGVPLALATALEVAKLRETVDELITEIREISNQSEIIKQGKCKLLF